MLDCWFKFKAPYYIFRFSFITLNEFSNSGLNTESDCLKQSCFSARRQGQKYEPLGVFLVTLLIFQAVPGVAEQTLLQFATATSTAATVRGPLRARGTVTTGAAGEGKVRGDTDERGQTERHRHGRLPPG